MIALDMAARLLGGDIANRSNRQIVCPGPGHSRRDRSLSVWLRSHGFRVHSYAGDDFALCRDHVAERLGLDGFRPGEPMEPTPIVHDPAPPERNAGDVRRALSLWNASRPLLGTLGDTYLRGRGLDPTDAGEALRWHDGIGALLGLFRDVLTGEPRAVTRIFIDSEGKKIERKFLGPTKGAAVMLDPPEHVAAGLHVGEGVETVLAGRLMGFRPAWALGSAGAIGDLPVLEGIGAVTAFREDDKTGANARACDALAARWLAAGREVLFVEPLHGGDLNDAIRRAA